MTKTKNGSLLTLVAHTLMLTLIIACNATAQETEKAATPKDEAVATQEKEKAATPKKEEKKKVEGDWGHLTGTLLVKGKVAAQPLEDVSGNKDAAECKVDGKIPADDNLIVGKKGELKDVVIMMYRKSSDPEPKIHPDYEETFKENVVADNKDCRFAPHIVMAQVGQTIELKNSDKVGHNCHGTTFNHEFNPNVPAGKSAFYEIKEDADKVPGKIVCDMHKWMDCVLVIKDNPYMTASLEDGTFEIPNIPAGTWKFQFWHVKSGYMKKLDIPGHKVGRRGEIEVTIKKDEALDLGELTIDAKELEK